MFRREQLRAISLGACLVAFVLGIWILSDGIQLPPPDVGTPDLGPELAMGGGAVIALAVAGFAVTVMAFRTADRVTKTEALHRRPDIDLSGSGPVDD